MPQLLRNGLTMTTNNNQHLDQEPPFSDEEKKLYQAAYQKLQEKVNVSFYDPVKSFAKIEERLGLNKSKNEILNKSWLNRISEYFTVNFGISVGIQASSAAISVFAIGIIFGLYVNTGPSYKGGQTNSTSDVLRGRQNLDKLQKVVLVKPDPVGFINLIVDSGLDAGLEIKTAKADSAYLIVISGLKANNQKQAGIKAILGLESSQEGDVLIELSGDKGK